jgi:molybdopterin synthase catalytic subunit
VLFFGPLKDALGADSQTCELAPGSTVGQLRARYTACLSANVLASVNREFAPDTRVLKDGDEVAFLPPVSGGASPWTHAIDHPAGHFFGLTRESLQAGALREHVLRNSDGAIVVFEGVTRALTAGRRTRYLEYDCYEEMAVRVMAELGADIAARHEIGRLAMAHRLGRVEIGQTSVVVAVAAPHRQAAFEAAREGIDRLKKTVPIWKKEYFEDGAAWVEGEWDNSIAGL